METIVNAQPLICVAEPSTPIRAILKTLLEQSGYDVVAAASAEHATMANNPPRPFDALVEADRQRVRIVGPALTLTLRKPFDVDELLADVAKVLAPTLTPGAPLAAPLCQHCHAPINAPYTLCQACFELPPCATCGHDAETHASDDPDYSPCRVDDCSCDDWREEESDGMTWAAREAPEHTCGNCGHALANHHNQAGPCVQEIAPGQWCACRRYTRHTDEYSEDGRRIVACAACGKRQPIGVGIEDKDTEYFCNCACYGNWERQQPTAPAAHEAALPAYNPEDGAPCAQCGHGQELHVNGTEDCWESTDDRPATFCPCPRFQAREAAQRADEAELLIYDSLPQIPTYSDHPNGIIGAVVEYLDPELYAEKFPQESKHTHFCPTCHQARPCTGTGCADGPRECATCSNCRGW